MNEIQQAVAEIKRTQADIEALNRSIDHDLIARRNCCDYIEKQKAIVATCKHTLSYRCSDYILVGKDTVTAFRCPDCDRIYVSVANE